MQCGIKTKNACSWCRLLLIVLVFERLSRRAPCPKQTEPTTLKQEGLEKDTVGSKLHSEASGSENRCTSGVLAAALQSAFLHTYNTCSSGITRQCVQGLHLHYNSFAFPSFSVDEGDANCFKCTGFHQGDWVSILSY